MTSRRSPLAPNALAAACSLCAALGAAESDTSEVVARVGPAAITAGEVERRLADLPGPQLAALEATPAAQPRALVERVLIPERLAELGAQARGLDKSPRVVDRTRELLRQVMDSALRREAIAQNPVTKAEIQRYFEENRSRFEQPLRLRIWRILVDDEEKAKKLLGEARASGQPPKWSELAREHSIDKATNLRQGDLGFVHPDGGTDAPRVRVDAALYAAAKAVKDGEFVPKPVAEAGKFAVVWRRGSLPPKTRTLEQETASITQLLERRHIDEARQALLQKLRQERVKDEHPELLDQLPEGLLKDDRPRATRRPPKLRTDGGLELPRPTERGLR